MTEDEFTEEDLENFEDKSEEEKIKTIQRLHKKLAESDGTIMEDVPIEGEITVRVLDEDGNEKQVEKEEIEY